MRTNCGECGAHLGAHNVTGPCLECALIARNARIAGVPVPADPTGPADGSSHSTLAQAVAIATVVLGARRRDADDIYSADLCPECSTTKPSHVDPPRMWHDTGRCDWYSARLSVGQNHPVNRQGLRNTNHEKGTHYR